MKSINLPAGTVFLPFNVLDRYIASAIHPEADQQPQRAACAWQLERDLMRAVQEGKLQLRNPATKRRLPKEAGYVAQIQSVVTVKAFRKYVDKEHCLTVCVGKKEAAPPHSGTADKSKRTKERTVRDVALPYIKQVFSGGQYVNAKELFKALEAKAGTPDSPFDKGTGQNAGCLFVRNIHKSLAFGTVANYLAEIRRAT